jgi:hypothetical protein
MLSMPLGLDNVYAIAAVVELECKLVLGLADFILEC